MKTDGMFCICEQQPETLTTVDIEIMFLGEVLLNVPNHSIPPKTTTKTVFFTGSINLCENDQYGMIPNL